MKRDLRHNDIGGFITRARKLDVRPFSDQGEDAAGSGQVFGGDVTPDPGSDGGGFGPDGSEQFACGVRGTEVRAVPGEQPAGQQLAEYGADGGGVGLEGVADLGAEVLGCLRGVGGDGGAQGNLLGEGDAVPKQDVLPSVLFSFGGLPTPPLGYPGHTPHGITLESGRWIRAQAARFR
ncbi:hypothetical protein ABZ318_31935 [Streptomyces sp. NPDC006197]|uniref:hypothetical protein n=1 Tax=Streptomyces sp. NPDC006197 TaxID=3156685 RepID=UPI0033B26ACC